MFGLPTSLEVDKEVTRRFLADEKKIPAKFRDAFLMEIEAIRWTHNIGANRYAQFDDRVEREIQIFQIDLRVAKPNEKLLELVDAATPYDILLVLAHGEYLQPWLGVKELAKTYEEPSRVLRYFHQGFWTPKDEFRIPLEGRKVDEIVRGFFRFVAPEIRLIEGEPLLETVERLNQIDAIRRQLKRVETKKNRERQFNRQCALRAEFETLQRQLDALAKER